MRKLRDSSEMKEAAILLSEIIEATKRLDAAEATKRGERLENSLASMCARAGFSFAVIVDGAGLVLADYEPNIASDTVGAFTVVLVEALTRIGSILEQKALNAISFDFDFTDKIVIRKFEADDEPYYLVVRTAHETDERAEIELSVEQIASIISLR